MEALPAGKHLGTWGEPHANVTQAFQPAGFVGNGSDRLESLPHVTE